MKKKILYVLVPVLVLLLGGYALWQQGGEGTAERFSVRRAETEEPTVTPWPKGTPAAQKSDEQDGALQQRITVHVCGAVEKEGVYCLAKDSRLNDAVEMAGGFTEAADRVYHNLAQKLLDGQRIYIPTKEETSGESPLLRADRTEQEGTESLEAHRRINLNTAGKEALMTLPGIGAAKAEQILAYREKTGGFQKPEEIKNVSGIGEGLYEQIKQLISTE